MYIPLTEIENLFLSPSLLPLFLSLKFVLRSLARHPTDAKHIYLDVETSVELLHLTYRNCILHFKRFLRSTNRINDPLTAQERGIFN